MMFFVEIVLYVYTSLIICVVYMYIIYTSWNYCVIDLGIIYV